MDLRVPGATIAVTAVAAVLVVTSWAHAKTPPDALQGNASTPEQANLRAGVILDRAYQIGEVRLPQPATYTSLPFGEHEVEQSRWLSTPGSPADIVALIATHPPAGLVVTARNRLTRSADESYYGETIELKPYGRSTSSLHILDVTAFPSTATRSTVLLQATVGWVPPRTAAERIPDNATGVVLSVGLGPSPTAFQTVDLNAEQTKYVAFLLNQLPATSMEAYDECPGVDLGVAIVDLPAEEYRVQLGGCHRVTVTVREVSQPMLLGDDGLDLELTKMLGTTPNGG